MMDDLWNGAQGRSSRAKHGARRRTTLYPWLVGLLVVGAVATAVVLSTANVRFLRGFLSGLLRSGQQTTGAYLGVTVHDLDPATARALGLDSDTGVVITKVLRPSPAAEVGLLPGDVVVRYDQQRVQSSSELQRLLGASDAGEKIKIVVDRKGTLRSFFVELGPHPTSELRAASGESAAIAQWGCTLAPLDASLTKQLSLPSSTQGVAVVAVDSAGLADAAGLRVGDVITAVNREPTPDLRTFYKELDGKQTVVLQVYRSGEVLYARIQTGSASPPAATIAGAVADGASLPQRVALAANGTDLSAQLAARFGTAPYFIIADLGSNRFVAIQNNIAPDVRGYGAGAAQLVASQGVGAVIAVGFGPPAFDALQALRVTPFSAAPGAVVDVLWQYRAGLLPRVGEPTLPGYGYARSLTAVGGGTEDDEEEQSGYRGMPPTIPPRGKYEPEAVAPATGQTVAGPVAAQATVGSSQRSDYCYCPICNRLVPHPPNVACSQLACPLCGNRLMNWDAGSLGGGGGMLPMTPGLAQAPGANPLSPGAVSAVTAPAALPGASSVAAPTVLPGTNAGLVPAPLPGTSGLYLNQTQYCYCPVCNALHPKPAGIPCAALACPTCGTRLVSPTAGATASAPLLAPSATTGPTASLPLLTPSANTGTTGSLLPPSVGMGPAGMPGTMGRMGPPMGGIAVGGQPTSIPPMGQPTAGIVVGGQPTTIPPMGQPTAGIAVGGQPTSIPPMGQPTAGIAVGGQPTSIPPMGQPTAGIVVGGQPTTIPPMGQGTAVAGPSSIPPVAFSTQGITIAGPTSIPPGGPTRPRGQTTAGVLVGGKPDTIPPMGPPVGQTSAGVTVAGSGTIPLLPQATTGATGAPALPGALQGTIDGNCICPRCGRTVPHVRGTACYSIPCPSCGTPMLREGTVFAPQVAAGTTAQLPVPPPLPASPGWPGLTVRPGAAAQLPPLVASSPWAVSPVAGSVVDGPLTVAADSKGKICIAATGPTIDAQVAPLFGRAPYFLMFGLGTFEVLPNPNVYDRTGVGVQSAQLVVSEGAKAIITYDISVNALQEFQRLRVTVYSGVNGTARDALQWYQAGRLSPASLTDTQTGDEQHEEHSSGKGKGSSSSSSSSRSL